MKYCQICGKENNDTSGFCENCGAKFADTVIPTYQNEKYQYSQRYQPTTQKKSKKGYIIGAVVAVIIAVMLVSIWYFMPFLDDNGITKIPVEGGPQANIGSMASGSASSAYAMTTPNVDHTAVYGFYINDERIGEISFTNVGEELYSGILCYKIVGECYYDFSSSQFSSYSSITATSTSDMTYRISMSFTNYVNKLNNVVVHADYNMQTPKIPGSSSAGQTQMTMDLNQETNEIIITTTSNDNSNTITYTVSDNYWSMSDIQNYLYVGYSNEYTITYEIPYSSYYSDDFEVSDDYVNIEPYSMDYTITIEVIGQEDISVEKGTFEDCYIIQIDQDTNFIIMTTKLWVTDDGICPKMTFSTGSPDSMENATGSTYTMGFELEEYYTT
jgi:hypothetical protein